MHLVTLVLLLLFATAISNILAGFVRMPLPLLQIAVGAAGGLIGIHAAFEPGVFLLLFIPPLLFADAYRMPKQQIGEKSAPVLLLAVGLVLFTMIGVGHIVHWILPVVPLAAAFALAAVLAPTDAVAVGGIMAGRAVPKRFMHILEGEALFNDASGLVSFNFAVAAVVTGSFSLGQATVSFVIVALGGIVVGAALGWGFAMLDRRVLSRRIDEASIYVTLMLLLPFAAYVLAEHLAVSGILAAVAAGLTVSWMNPFGPERGSTRLGVTTIWGVLEYAFNGVIFLLLGLQLPAIFKAGIALTERAHFHARDLLLLILIVTASLILLRFVWVVVSLELRRWSHRLRRRDFDHPGLAALMAMSVAGVRGAVSLAGILSLPLVTDTGEYFPARDVLIAVAGGVIVCSIIIASVALPLLLRSQETPGPDPVVEEAAAARQALAEAALKEMARVRTEALARRSGAAREGYERASKRVQDEYLRRLVSRDGGDDNQDRAIEERRAEIALWLRAVRAERAEMRRLRSSHEIGDEAMRLLLEELDMTEQTLSRIADTLPRRVVARS